MADKILATFRIEPEKWELFKALATSNNSTASAVLLQVVNDCLDNNQIPSTSGNHAGLDKVEVLIDKRIEESLDKVKVLIDEHIEKNLAASLGEVRSQLEESFSEVRSQLEELRGKSKAR
ncbi:MAG: hypothetical protein V7K40_30990 [Nostoc sp.]|uniref:hypothetical protein n=1 Tax=Nostoc sp. TaxID=1180 RepID=UPI002FF5BA82